MNRGVLGLVSVVIPTYNHARFLPEAVASVHSQSYSQWEIIVVDDGSVDDTAAVASRLPEVRYHRQLNAGAAAARNTGIRMSRGSYLVFLDADDRLLPNALAAGVALLEQRSDCAFASGQYLLVGPEAELLERPKRRCPSTNHYGELLRGNYIGMHATVVYRRGPVEAAGGFDPGLPSCEDYDLYLRLARSNPACCHAEVVAEYRQHGTNKSSDPARMLRASLAVLGRQRKHAYSDAALKAAWAAGTEYYRSFYGSQLIDRLRRHEREHAWRPALRELAILWRYHPRGFRHHLATKGVGLLRRLVGHRPKPRKS